MIWQKKDLDYPRYIIVYDVDPAKCNSARSINLYQYRVIEKMDKN
ncbi:MAG: hypothetical protein ACTSRG_09050 [Candidatus Helarchaeota archaeon]